MDVKPFRSPLTALALALWVGCLQWPLTVPLALALPLLYRRHKARSSAFSFLLLLCAGLDRTIGSACDEPCSVEAQNGLLDMHEKRSCRCWRTATSLQE